MVSYYVRGWQHQGRNQGGWAKGVNPPLSHTKTQRVPKNGFISLKRLRKPPAVQLLGALPPHPVCDVHLCVAPLPIPLRKSWLRARIGNMVNVASWWPNSKCFHQLLLKSFRQCFSFIVLCVYVENRR